MRPIYYASVTLVTLLLPGCGAGDGDGEGSAIQAAAAAALGQEDGNTYQMKGKGDIEFNHSGAVLCDVYRQDLRLAFAQTEDIFTSYEIAVAGFDGAGDYEGTLTIARRGEESEGSVKLKTKLREGEILPVLSGTITGDYEGEVGSGTVEGSFSCATDMGNMAAVSSAPKSGAWIEYTVSGDVSLSDREEVVVMCSETSDGFRAHTFGGWNFTLQADGAGPGDHGVRFRVAAPQQIEVLHDDDFRTDDRFYGDGILTLERAGKDNFGFDAVRVRFSATGLESDAGHTINVEGSLFCGVM